jgi:hypothetical protein
MKSYLGVNYDLYCYNSKPYTHDNFVKIITMMGSSLMIVIFQNNENQHREINRTRKLKIPILFISKRGQRRKYHLLLFFFLIVPPQSTQI